MTDIITVKPLASPQKVQEVIEDAFKREAEVDARHISVGVSYHTAKLYGHVHSVHEAAAARAAAASAPGISAVESHLVAPPRLLAVRGNRRIALPRRFPASALAPHLFIHRAGAARVYFGREPPCPRSGAFLLSRRQPMS